MPTIKEAQQQVVDCFAQLDSWEQRYQFLIEKGNQLKPLGSDFQVEKNRLHGCQSQVWVVVDEMECEGGAVLMIRAFSDAAIVRGLIALLLEVYSGHTAQEILAAKLDFIVKIGLIDHLSPNRKNGLSEMVKHIYRLAKQSLLNSETEIKQ